MLALAAQLVFAQSLTTGDISGTVTDQTGGLLAGVTVTITNNATGAKQTTQTNAAGIYRFAFLAPGTYSITWTHPGFQAAKQTTTVALGQGTVQNAQLNLATATTTIQVTEAAVAVQADNGNISTSYNLAQVQDMPNPGQDLTYYAQTAPGALMNTTGEGYGNFSTFGLPATSNIFTINGQTNNDPFLNLNNSGASNLMLGFNEIGEATVVNNAYSGQYGMLAGSQVNYVSRSGANEFHGDAIYFWNGRAFNTNSFFNNAAGVPTPFSNVNQWAANFGGPVRKNKTFFFLDTEGARIVFPESFLVLIPSPAFQSATLANLAATGQTGAIPFYQNMFKVYNSAPGAGAATPVLGGGCDGGAFTALGAGVACADQFRTAPNGETTEQLYTIRVDHTFSEKDRAYVRVQRDNGTQGTYVDPINSAFNILSPQPEMQGQINENHTFGSTAINNLIVSGQFYAAVFGSAAERAQEQALFPTTLTFASGEFTNLGGEDFNFPQGRRVTQYQVIDDFSKTAGNHSLKAGINFHRVDLTDLDFQKFTSGLVIEDSLEDFYSGGGVGNSLIQNFPSQNEQPLAYYNLGAYIQDEWSVTKSFKITPTLRIDHNSNPVCQHNCFSELTVPFTSLDHNANIPYNQAIDPDLNQAFYSTTNILWEPRIGFAWTPTKSGNTVLRGGVGLFGDSFPGFLAEDFALNAPQLNSFTVPNGKITPGVAGNLYTIAAQANTSLLNAFANGGTLASITASNPYFTAPNITSSNSNYKQAYYAEWNLEVQQAFGSHMLFSVNYVGNHGWDELLQNGGLNAYFPGFTGLPATPADARFGQVIQFDTGAYSNYDGLIVSLRRSVAAGFTFQANYTYSHALDIVSNGGVLPFNFAGAITAGQPTSVLLPQDPYNTRLNYGNADYDVRSNASINYVWDDVIRHLTQGGPNILAKGWVLSGTLFARSGLPFTVVDGAATGSLEANNYSTLGSPFQGDIFATPLTPGFNGCGPNAVNPATPCLSLSQFTAANPTPTGFGNQGRNQYRGPVYFDTDMSLMKAFPIAKWEAARFQIGVQVFNLFNHPNFAQPISDVSNPLFGSIVNPISPPTSILGAFVGADASGRIIQLKAMFAF